MEKRIVQFYVALIICLTGVLVQLAVLTTGDSLAAAARDQSSYVMDVGESRGYFYDRNLKPLVNRQERIALAVAPTPKAMEVLQEVLPQEQFEESLAVLQNQKPTVIAAQAMPLTQGEGLLAFQLPVRYQQNQQAVHLLGYTDASGKGVSGLEKGYDRQLAQWGGQIQVKYLVSATGRTISEEAQEVRDTLTQARGGVVLTLDREIQQVVEEAMDQVPRGACVVMKAGTGEILALVSRPAFDIHNLADALDSPDSPFFNRALGAYSVGSGFKIAVAAAALESGYGPDYSYTCTGSYQLGEQIYHCNRRMGHGTLTMTEAIEQSCNPYFINLGQRLGAQAVYRMAYNLGFGSATRLGEGIFSAAGSLPPPEEVSRGELANLSFGQGRLTATPVQMAQMLSIVAGGGMWVSPTVVQGTTQDGATLDPVAEQPPQKRVMSQATARRLVEMLVGAVDQGSGRNAKPQVGSAGGKTSTAQTGSYQEDKEIVHAWFCGFFPGEEPQYTVAVFAEGGGEGGVLPAKVFRQISEEIQYQALRRTEPFLE